MNSTQEQHFRPISAFKHKLYFTTIVVFLIITTCFVGFLLFLMAVDKDIYTSIMSNDILPLIITGYLAVSFLWIIPVIIVIPFYVRIIEYQIKENEIIIKKGLINRMEKHIPFRTITNISSRCGPFDRLFSIGTIEIETAGKSGATLAPEGKIEGIKNYREIRDLILAKLREINYEGSYVTTTEVPEKQSLETNVIDQQFLKAMLIELQEIKKILQTK